MIFVSLINFNFFCVSIVYIWPKIFVPHLNSEMSSSNSEIRLSNYETRLFTPEPCLQIRISSLSL